MSEKLFRVKVISADGSWQYLKVGGLHPQIYLAAMPLLKAVFSRSEDYSTTHNLQKRRYILYGRNKNGIYIYREDIP